MNLVFVLRRRILSEEHLFWTKSRLEKETWPEEEETESYPALKIEVKILRTVSVSKGLEENLLVKRKSMEFCRHLLLLRLVACPWKSFPWLCCKKELFLTRFFWLKKTNVTETTAVSCQFNYIIVELPVETWGVIAKIPAQFIFGGRCWLWTNLSGM